MVYKADLNYSNKTGKNLKIETHFPQIVLRLKENGMEKTCLEF